MRQVGKIFFLIVSLICLFGCGHEYKSDALDLAFYQWNLWPDPAAQWNRTGGNKPPVDLRDLPRHPPSCGWEELHRGTGELVRIPATVMEHVSREAYSGVTWFHVRYTLPESWERRKIVLKFEGGGQRTEVYLNKELAGYHAGAGSPFEVDITPMVYYTRDNHLAIRISDPSYRSASMGGLIIKSSVKPQGASE